MHMGKDSTKLWPVDHYNRLLAFIKKHYTTIKIVQLGISDDRCPALENIDINLVGKTNFEELKALVAKSSFHIDCRSEEHTSELQSQHHISYAVFCLKK